MKKYKFKLESILGFRERIEEQLRSELSDLHHNLAEEEARVTNLERYYNEETDRMLERGEITPLELTLYNGYLSGIRTRIEDGHKIVATCTARVENKREELLEAAKEKKVLEVMKEKDHKEYHKAILKIEQRMLDEHSTNKFITGNLEKDGTQNA